MTVVVLVTVTASSCLRSALTLFLNPAMLESPRREAKGVELELLVPAPLRGQSMPAFSSWRQAQVKKKVQERRRQASILLAELLNSARRAFACVDILLRDKYGDV